MRESIGSLARLIDLSTPVRGSQAERPGPSAALAVTGSAPVTPSAGGATLTGRGGLLNITV
jgi:hypothetical protein